jgi:hypothetical protein
VIGLTSSRRIARPRGAGLPILKLFTVLARSKYHSAHNFIGDSPTKQLERGNLRFGDAAHIELKS